MEKLGINPFLILTQAVNFFILLAVLSKFLYKPILGMLAKRREAAEKTMALRSELEDEKSKLDEKKQEIVHEGKKKAEVLVNDARKKGEDLAKQIEADAKAKAKEIVASGQKQLEVREQEIVNKLKDEVAQVAVEAARSVIGSTITSTQKDQITAEAVRRFTSHA